MRGVLANKDGINPKISKSAEVTAVLFKDAPRLIPPEFNPNCVETFIEIKNDVPMDTSITKTKKPTKAKQKSKAKPTKKVNAKTFCFYYVNKRQASFGSKSLFQPLGEHSES